MTTPQKAPSTNRNSVALQLRQGLEQMRPQFRVSLPSHIPPERFERVVMTAIAKDPNLLVADRRSLYNECLKAANDGLLPDGREGALVTFNDRSGKKTVQWMPMVFGLIKKIRQSGEISSIGARIVYQKEIDAGRFRYVIEDGEPKISHEPMLWGDRGEKVLVYAYAKFKDTGYVEYEPLHKLDVMKRKNVSRAKNSGPWAEWEEEMWKKTAIRVLAKRLPLSAEIMKTIEREDEPTEFARLRDAATQDADVALAQLGAPEDAPPSEGVPTPNDAGAGMLGRLIDDVRDFSSREDLEDFALRGREIIKSQEFDDEDRLIGEFNAAVLSRIKELT